MKLEPCHRASCMQIIDALKAELGDLPEAQAEMLAQIKADEALMQEVYDGWISSVDVFGPMQKLRARLESK